MEQRTESKNGVRVMKSTEQIKESYARNRIAKHGIPFWLYQCDPAKFDELALDPEPLLPEQEAVARRIAGEAG
jgi:hypothetical protein